MKIDLFSRLLAVVLLTGFTLVGCSSSSDDKSSGSVTIDLSAAGKFSVPPVTGSGTGSGSITLNRDSGELSGSITLSNLSGAITAAHIHEGLAGLTGSIVVTLEQDTGNASRMNVPTGTTLSQAQMDALLAARYYVNVHTAANASGEVRAQIIPAGYEVMRVLLKGENMVPSEVSTSNSGVGYVTLNSGSGEASGNVRNTGMDDASAVHVHSGFAGANGGILLGLTQDSGDMGLWTFSSTTLDSAQLAEMTGGGTYFNVHTPANGSGEVRGQIIPSGIELDRVELGGEFQVPTPVTSAGSGVGYITVNTASGSIVANVRTSGLSDNTAGHIHRGFAGENGAVVVTLEQDASDQSLFSSASSAMFDATALNDFATGKLYFNIHTGTNASGEVRGQIAPGSLAVTRTLLDGSQEVPSVSTSASGIGYTTVNTGDGSVVANVRTSGVTASAAHIHEGAAGANGGVAIGLTQDLTDTDFWSATGTLDAAQLNLFDSNGLYFNVHSSTNPAGEIRGQVTP